MDNRINKKRLSDFLAYEWIVMIVLCAVVIFAWELIYTVSAVRLTVGQDYRFFYDYYIPCESNYDELLAELGLQDDLGYGNGKTFSFDVLEVDSERFDEENDVIEYRIGVQEGDMLITDDKNRTKTSHDVKYPQSTAKLRVDHYDQIGTLEKLLADAKSYLTGLLFDGVTEIKAENLDPAKIERGFYNRLGKDNRYRSNDQKAIGITLETERLKKLCVEVADFQKIMELPDEYFFVYTRFTQFLEISTITGLSEETINKHKTNIQTEIDAGRENARFGIRIGEINKYDDELTKANAGKKDVSRFFKVIDESVDVSKHVVIMVFDYLDAQPELQFESITVINNIVRACSTVLD